MTAPLIDIYDRTYLNPQINTVVNDYTGRTYPMQQNIPVLLHEYYMGGLNQYRKFSNWLDNSYDLTGRFVDKLLHSNAATAVRKEVLGKLDIKNGDRVLCIGIGSGADLTCLPEHIDVSTLQISGVDISLNVLQKCRKNLDKWGIDAQLINCCAEALPFEDNYFDVVFFAGDIDQCSDREQAIKEMIRVARPGRNILFAGSLAGGEKKTALPIPAALVPGTMEDIAMDTYRKNRFYSIRFRKPL